MNFNHWYLKNLFILFITVIISDANKALMQGV